MKLIFVGDIGYRGRLWDSVVKLLNTTVESFWLSITSNLSDQFKDVLKKSNYDFLVFLDDGIFDFNLMDAVVLVADRRKPFLIVSKKSEDEVKEALFIDDMQGGPECFYYLMVEDFLAKDLSQKIAEAVQKIKIQQ